jgi:putative restriction endonuclease
MSQMDPKATFLKRITQIRVYRRNLERAPSKPLYLLKLLADMQKGLPRLRPFVEIEAELTEALRIFGLATKSGAVSPQYPFWRLKNDRLAEVIPEGPYEIRKSSDDPTITSLRKGGASGGLMAADFDLLDNDLAFQTIVVHQILEEHFPRSIHEDLIRFYSLRMAGMRSEDAATEAEFRGRVIRAYGYRCAISGYRIDFRNDFPGLEAAHICWPQAGGNDDVANGIAMNSLIRKLFHLGLFGVDDDFRVVVSSAARETGGSKYLSAFQGSRLSLPETAHEQPARGSLAWHMKWVFRG